MRLMHSLGTALQPYNESSRVCEEMVEYRGVGKVEMKQGGGTSEWSRLIEIFPFYASSGQTLVSFAQRNTGGM